MNLIPSPRQQPEPSLRRWLLAQLMRIANRNGHPQWWVLKSRLLDFYGKPDGFDTQRYEAKCWTCGGEGDCYDCNDGVHHVTRTVLNRTIIEGVVFRTPVQLRIFDDAELDEIEQQDGWHKRLVKRGFSQRTHPNTSAEAIGWIFLLCGGYKALFRWLCSGVWWTEGPLLPLSFARTVIRCARDAMHWRQRLLQSWRLFCSSAVMR